LKELDRVGGGKGGQDVPKAKKVFGDGDTCNGQGNEAWGGLITEKKVVRKALGN